jgi:hypothetical protein
MSKIEDLRKKYPDVTTSTFTKFLSADTTPTKKYLDFMLKTWEDRKIDASYRTTGNIIKYVDKFNQLLPYIANKDIYSKDYYGNFTKLIATIEKAEETREDKSFVKEDHINVVFESDKILLIQPLTHRGSIKYGANTKWCTTAKNNQTIFKNYTKEGLLFYLIDKTETKSKDYEKIALYLEFKSKGLNDNIRIYDVKDNCPNEETLVSNGGWDIDELFEVFTTFRYYFIRAKEYNKSKDFVNNFINTINKLDFTKLESQLNRLEKYNDLSYIQEAKESLELFTESLNKRKYGVRKA